MTDVRREADLWLPYFETREIEIIGQEWPEVIIEKWERNSIGETRFTGQSRAARVAAALIPSLRRDPRVDWTAVEHLVDAAIRRGTITASRGAEILGLRLRTWRDRALEIREEGNPLSTPSPSEPSPNAGEVLVAWRIATGDDVLPPGWTVVAGTTPSPSDLDAREPECIADGSHSDDLSHAAELRERTGRHAARDGPSCPGCGLPNYEGLCPRCRGDQDAYERELVPPFPTSRETEEVPDDPRD